MHSGEAVFLHMEKFPLEELRAASVQSYTEAIHESVIVNLSEKLQSCATHRTAV